MACRVCKTPLNNIRIYFLVIPNDIIYYVSGSAQGLTTSQADWRIFHKTTRSARNTFSFEIWKNYMRPTCTNYLLCTCAPYNTIIINVSIPIHYHTKIIDRETNVT